MLSATLVILSSMSAAIDFAGGVGSVGRLTAGRVGLPDTVPAGAGDGGSPAGAAIGVAAIIALVIFSRMAKRWKDMDA